MAEGNLSVSIEAFKKLKIDTTEELQEIIDLIHEKVSTVSTYVHWHARIRIFVCFVKYCTYERPQYIDTLIIGIVGICSRL
jgi:hypothetical protein